ncbi:proteasome assembly chaperone 2-like isoform X2 [Myxocyprinus asiaticus]|uniref:proteasome assembly chaperone 2-like isoform X2 n=1 Tax=Myxocyprinus asiaticus TaxID=70543 RepID=UPI0022224576|nr:proteasome assembly chaperone 2-like isoform X2 [Myxocyprinus asiaticus]
MYTSRHFWRDKVDSTQNHIPYKLLFSLYTFAHTFSWRVWVFLQLQTKVSSFRKLMVSWIKSCGFLRTVLLSSSHAYQRDDQQLFGTHLRYLLTPSLQKEEGQRVGELGWREMERISILPDVCESEQRLYIPGGGVTKALYTDCCTEDISMAVLLIFCSEGDNIPDAFMLINHLNDWLHLLEKPTQGSVQWKVPPSWRLLFGSGIPPQLF